MLVKATKITILLLLFSCTLISPLERFPANIREDLVGIEATFTNSSFQKGAHQLPPELDTALERLSTQIKIICSDCEVRSYIGSTYETEYKVRLKSGITLNLGKDQKVIEVTADPIPRSKLNEVTKEIQDTLFSAAKRAGLNPAKHTGGGHLHFDRDAFFKGDVTLLRDYLVDTFNNQMMLKSFFGGEVNNAPTFSDLPLESQRNFITLISDFDNSPFSFYEFVERMEREVFNRTYNSTFTPTQKYQAISFIHMLKPNGTIEFRAIRPYKKASHIETIAEVLLRRRDYLEMIRERGNAPMINASPKLSGKKAYQGALQYLEDLALKNPKTLALFPSAHFAQAMREFQGEERFSFLLEYIEATSFDDFERVKVVLEKNVLRTFSEGERDLIAEKLFYLFDGTDSIEDLKKSFQKLGNLFPKSFEEYLNRSRAILFKDTNCGEDTRKILKLI